MALVSLSLSLRASSPFESKKKKKKFYPLPPALSSYPRKSDRLPKFPFDLFRAERVERNLHRGIHRYPTGLTRGKRLKDPGEDARGRCKGKEERGSEIREKLSPFFLFLSFGRRLVLKRWSQKISFDFRVFFQFLCLGGEKSLRQRYKTHNKHTRSKAQNAESAKEDGGLRTPPSSRAFPSSSSSSSSSSRFLLFCSPFSACAGESFRKQTQREREREGEKGRPVRFSARIFLLLCFVPLSLLLSLLLFLSLLSCCCFVFSSRNETTTVISSPSSSLIQNKKSKSASRARV